MRNILKSRRYSHARWVHFNLACLDHILDLITDTPSLNLLQAVNTYVANPERFPVRTHIQSDVMIRESLRELYRQRKEPLFEAKIAASRAVEAVLQKTLETSEMVSVAVGRCAEQHWPARREELRVHCHLLRDIFGNPFRPVAFDSRWRSESAIALARTAYDTRNFTLLPILADALEEVGCDHPDVLAHCRDPQQIHVRGCWVVDGVLGKV
jgi:hypothetical protein